MRFVASIALLRDHPSGGSAAAEIFDLRKDAGSVTLVRVYLAPFSGSVSLIHRRRSGT
jgi:hypothetical protein